MNQHGKVIKCCYTCVYYEWYYDKCTKFNCEVDSRSYCSFYKPQGKESEEEE